MYIPILGVSVLPEYIELRYYTVYAMLLYSVSFLVVQNDFRHLALFSNCLALRRAGQGPQRAEHGAKRPGERGKTLNVREAG